MLDHDPSQVNQCVNQFILDVESLEI
jgi:hypothetical protein